MPCNFHLRSLAQAVKEASGGGGHADEFNTISVSDGVVDGHRGDEGLAGQPRGDRRLDELVCARTCSTRWWRCRLRQDHPRRRDGAPALNLPGLLLYGGSIAPGRFEDRDVTIQDVFEAVGAHAAGKMPLRALHELEDVACPDREPAAGSNTANTMALATELLGSPRSGTRASRPRSAQGSGDARRRRAGGGSSCVRNRRPLDVVNRASFENAIAGVAATGGSTNAVLHLLALAREAGVPLALGDFDDISRRTPLIADLKPGGRFVATDFHRAGGTPLLCRRLLEGGLLHARRGWWTANRGLSTPSMLPRRREQEVVRRCRLRSSRAAGCTS